ncbi:type II toxin-antitoxin system mRNA interferase toxin, RelE/StbE family [Candidatus Uhrbacteria bacterium]|nr:type II toxin-antitoxin system mRNA interferase toxin, RelE/StbE family [Candidatus Uhrbacteria bacterium]
MELYYSPRFRRSFKKFSEKFQRQAWKQIDLFQNDSFHPHLKTHKLSVDELWAFSIDYKNRIIFSFLDDSRVLLIDIGDHSIYRKI